MDGMRWQVVFAFGTVSNHVEMPPTSTIGQVGIVDYFDSTDPNNTSGGFDSCQFIDQFGVQRTNVLNGAASFDQNNMVRVDFTMFASADCSASYIVNLFFWPNVV